MAGLCGLKVLLLGAMIITVAICQDDPAATSPPRTAASAVTSDTNTNAETSAKSDMTTSVTVAPVTSPNAPAGLTSPLTSPNITTDQQDKSSGNVSASE